MQLNEIRPPKGAVKAKKRLGRGESSGLGKTSGRGHKGQKARSGGFHKVGFEGGQTPLQRRLPKRGFTPISRKEYVVVNVGQLNNIPAHTEVDSRVLQEMGLLKRLGDGLKILGEGELSAPLTIKADRFSESAKQKIEKAGGKIVVKD